MMIARLKSNNQIASRDPTIPWDTLVRLGFYMEPNNVMITVQQVPQKTWKCLLSVHHISMSSRSGNGKRSTAAIPVSCASSVQTEVQFVMWKGMV